MSTVQLADDETFVNDIREFANVKGLFGTSKWFTGKYMTVYLRNGERFIGRSRTRAITVANVTVFTQGQGVYSDFLKMLETLTRVIYVEGVFQIEQHPLYRRRDYVKIAETMYDPGWDFYKILD